MQIVMNHKHPENVENCRCWGVVRANYAKCTHVIRHVNVLAKTAFKRNENFHRQIRLKFKGETNEVLHLERGFVWC